MFVGQPNPTCPVMSCSVLTHNINLQLLTHYPTCRTHTLSASPEKKKRSLNGLKITLSGANFNSTLFQSDKSSSVLPLDSPLDDAGWVNMAALNFSSLASTYIRKMSTIIFENISKVITII